MRDDSVGTGPAVSRRGFLTALAGAAVVNVRRRPVRDPEVTRARPSASQLSWQRDELALFLHFGVNTFTNRNLGTGDEDPTIFQPSACDPGQWARVARDAGFRAMVLTAKHHDGFCLWPTRTTRHSVASSPWRGGHGDVVRDFVDAAKAFGLEAGLYLSPWDRHEPVYGDSPRYNDFYCDQLTELLTRYGRIAEVWFDGANGEGPNGRKQVYDWPRVWALVRRLQPRAVRFSDAGPDVRWIGNENGVAGDPNWSTVDPAIVSVPGVSGAAATAMLQHGDPNGSVWRPGETDVSIRPNWFYHPAEDGQVRTADNLMALYFTSVGRNSKLLLNVPPMPNGLLHDHDIAQLAAFRDRRAAAFATDLTGGRAGSWQRSGAGWTTEIDLGRAVPVGITSLAEDIARGQFVASYAIDGRDEGPWQRLTAGTTIGYRKLDRVSRTVVSRVRVAVTGAPDPRRAVRVALYEGPDA